MRQYILLAGFILACLTVQAQVKLGIKGGINTTQISPQEIMIGDFAPVSLAVKDARYGIHLGALLKITMNKFFIQPEVLLNSSTTTYTYTELNVGRVLEESYQFVDLPLLMGFDLGVLNLNAGPVGHVFVSSTSELKNLDGYRQKWNEVHWGWQAGLSFDIWRLNLDLRYEGNFYKYGDHVSFFGQTYDFKDSPSRVLTSLAFMF